MFQNFESTAHPGQAKERIEAIRKEMRAENIDWFLVPHADEHQNEYLPERAERLAWLTGFTGSAGFAIIGLTEAYVFSDGRYTVQMRNQLDSTIFTAVDITKTTPSAHLAKNAKRGARIAYDPWLITFGSHKTWANAASKAGAELIPVDNLIDRIWQNQPQPPLGRAFLHPNHLAGKTASEKIIRLQEIIRGDGANYLLITDPACIAWAFNIRGNDVVHNPLVLAFAILPANEEDQPILFIDRRKLDEETERVLRSIARISQPEKLVSELESLAPDMAFHCDPERVAYKLAHTITDAGGSIISKRDPIVLERAIKNDAELQGAQAAQLRDGVAMVRFLAWLDRQEPGSVDEISAAMELEQIRVSTATSMNSELHEIAFDTISGAGANAAIPHYRVSRESNTKLADGSIYLVDSGGQYGDGTTDITRTVTIGEPPEGAAANFTLVLKGHIAIDTVRFPAGTRGIDIDAFARRALWDHGKDFAHGTGHGVGSFLNVHEGPQSISRRGMEELKTGMILSNEPGYYKEGEYGIRIENLIVVREAEPVEGGDLPIHTFETLTLCPIDLRLVDKSLMTREEIDWLNKYHQRVRDELSGYLNDADAKWLKDATRKLK